MEKSLIKCQLDNKIFHIEISNNDNSKNIIEIHLKNSHLLEYQIGEKMLENDKYYFLFR